MATENQVSLFELGGNILTKMLRKSFCSDLGLRKKMFKTLVQGHVRATEDGGDAGSFCCDQLDEESKSRDSILVNSKEIR